jgi:flagellar protein FlaF
MHRLYYSEMVPDDPAIQRAQEREAFARSIALLAAAESAGPGSGPAREALEHVNKLWCYLIEDLSRPENDLPDDLRKALVTLGLRALHEVARIDRAESANFALLRQISTSIAAGLA